MFLKKISDAALAAGQAASTAVGQAYSNASEGAGQMMGHRAPPDIAPFLPLLVETINRDRSDIIKGQVDPNTIFLGRQISQGVPLHVQFNIIRATTNPAGAPPYLIELRGLIDGIYAERRSIKTATAIAHAMSSEQMAANQEKVDELVVNVQGEVMDQLMQPVKDAERTQQQYQEWAALPGRSVEAPIMGIHASTPPKFYDSYKGDFDLEKRRQMVEGLTDTQANVAAAKWAEHLLRRRADAAEIPPWVFPNKPGAHASVGGGKKKKKFKKKKSNKKSKKKKKKSKKKKKKSKKKNKSKKKSVKNRSSLSDSLPEITHENLDSFLPESANSLFTSQRSKRSNRRSFRKRNKRTKRR